MQKHSLVWKIFHHFKTITTHHFYVQHYCFMCGLYVQGLFHDLSKLSLAEFGESVKYYSGDRSPIDNCKDVNEYSLAWFHHRGRNKHHYEYWYDRFDTGGHACKMPWKYALEMVCDYLGAGAAYAGSYDKFSIEGEIAWWENKKKVAKMHEAGIWLVDTMFAHMQKYGIDATLKDRRYLRSLKKAYKFK